MSSRRNAPDRRESRSGATPKPGPTAYANFPWTQVLARRPSARSQYTGVTIKRTLFKRQRHRTGATTSSATAGIRTRVIASFSFFASPGQLVCPSPTHLPSERWDGKRVTSRPAPRPRPAPCRASPRSLARSASRRTQRRQKSRPKVLNFLACSNHDDEPHMHAAGRRARAGARG